MANDDKTEKATAKKRRDSREEGQVMKSTEVSTAACSIVMFAFMSIFWTNYINNMVKMFQKFFSSGVLQTGSHSELTINALDGVFSEAIISFAMMLLPVFAVAIVIGVAINLLQVGFLFTTKTLKPKFSRINPIQGFKRMFSLRSIVELLKSTLKVILLGYVMVDEYRKLMDTFAGYIHVDAYNALIEIGRTAFGICLKMSAVLIVIAALDFLYQWFKHEKDLMMTKQEVKDEYKNTEGDPQIKSRIRQKQRQMSAMRMMDAVPSADVVITNPTHYAVALKYEQGVDAAPKVIAKGQDFIARKIKEVAREHGIEIVENKPLAQALYNLCEVDDEIPEELYKAVADILVYIFKSKNKYPGVRR